MFEDRLEGVSQRPEPAADRDPLLDQQPEDVGGVSGYAYFLNILADPDDQEHSETLRWSGGYFDPEWFDLERINKDLRNTLRANARRPRDQPKPRRN
ncbi:IS1096 element passenger TnpR family protein [Solirhodobacter olei]|uniref:IS1096 element passenger TnpR family protein n=1 Tax=Solirhodobacter olei TaxID=2493082 RepID=UPI000FD793AF|nr:hypothetical protein [Solirhodobacter olei]